MAILHIIRSAVFSHVVEDDLGVRLEKMHIVSETLSTPTNHYNYKKEDLMIHCEVYTGGSKYNVVHTPEEFEKRFQMRVAEFF